MRSIGTISSMEAKEMGLELRATRAGPDAAWLELEFRIAGKLKDYDPKFSHVELEVRDGELLLGYVALQEKHPSPGRVRVQFMTNRRFIDKLVLTIVVGEGAMSGGAYEVRVKEFVDVRKMSKSSSPVFCGHLKFSRHPTTLMSSRSGGAWLTLSPLVSSSFESNRFAKPGSNV